MQELYVAGSILPHYCHADTLILIYFKYISIGFIPIVVIKRREAAFPPLLLLLFILLALFFLIQLRG